MAAVIAGILACTGILGVLIFITAIPNFCPDINSFNSFKDSEMWFLLFFFLPIGFCWFLAKNSNDLYTFNESGTKLFGRTPTDNGYIATKWICVFFFPVLPVTSYEVFAVENYSVQSRYAMNRLDKLYWPQIITTALKGFLSLAGIWIAFTVLFNFNCFYKFSR